MLNLHLPVQLRLSASSMKPFIHKHSNEPTVFSHIWSQGDVSLHSSISRSKGKMQKDAKGLADV